MASPRHTNDGPPIADALRRIEDAFSETGGAVRQTVSEELLRMAEAILFTAPGPVSAKRLAERLGAEANVAAILMQLKKSYEGRGVELKEVAGGWRFQTAPDLAWLFNEVRETTKKLPKAAMETLAVIAYHQPVTRAEIEEIRGVSLSRNALDLLMEIGWVRPLGRRRAPGRPLTFGTSAAFLEQFALPSLDALPGKDDLKGLGLLDSRLGAEVDIPRPADALAALQDDHDEAPFFVDHMSEGD